MSLRSDLRDTDLRDTDFLKLNKEVVKPVRFRGGDRVASTAQIERN